MHSLVAPAINFAVFGGALVYFLREPLKKMITDRRVAIKNQVDEAEAQKIAAERRYREFEQKLHAFEAEAKEILARAQTDGEEIRNRIITTAQATAERIIKDTEATALANIQEYKDQIRRETIAKAVELAERMIRDRLSSDDQRRIVNEYVEKVQ